MDAALMFFGLLWALLGGGRSSSSSSSWPETSPPTPTSTPPWPQVLPPELPPFPGNGWEFDEPPPPAVVDRARALVSYLWARGRGSYKVEQTAGRWIAYRAEIVASGKQGVVAYRLKGTRALPRSGAPARPQAQPAPSAPMARPQAAPRPPAPPAAVSRPSPASSPAPAPTAYRVKVGPAVIHPPVAPASPLTLPVLRFGDGMAPKQPDPNVRLLQQRLGIEADGRFGPRTRTAVIEFQRREGLAPNETNAQLLARGYGVVKQATWTKLFATAQA